MAKDINTVTVTGHLTKDPELRSTNSGTQLVTFSVACNDRRKNQQTDQWEDVPSFFDVTLFGPRAEWLSKDLHRGKLVTVHGRLNQSKWEKDGERRSKVIIVAEDVMYERPPRPQQGYQQQAYVPQQQAYSQPQYQQPQQYAPPQQQVPQVQDDIPF